MIRIFLVILFFMFTSSSFANSVISLNTANTVAAKSNLSLSLTDLVAGVTYTLVCYINTSNPFQYVQLNSVFGDNTSSILSYSINGKYVSQAQLNYGSNLAVINGFFNTPSAASLLITNLDQNNSFTVTNCFAVPIQKSRI